MYHCPCNYSSDLAKFIELHDVYASLAPRPLAATIGLKDNIFPYEGTKIAIPLIKSAYAESGFPNNFLMDVQPDGHRFYGEKLYPFIMNHL